LVANDSDALWETLRKGLATRLPERTFHDWIEPCRAINFDGTTLLIQVTAVPLIATITKQGSSLSLGWSGGVPLYQVQTTTNLANPGWQNLGSPTSLTNLMLAPGNAGVFYRVQGQ